VIVLLDYNDQDGLAGYIERKHADDLESGKLVYYRNSDAPRFFMGHAKNQAHRCAAQEGADILVTLDADNYMGAGFVPYVRRRFEREHDLSFLCPDFDALPPPGKRFNRQNPLRLGRGFAGRLAIRINDFFKAGGYNEAFDTWRGEDIDLLARLDRIGLKRGAINPAFLNAIAHSAAVRFKEYPEARKYEREDVYAITEHAHDTVVNYGNVGCGIVTRNFDDTLIPLEPIATRIFGIGMQRTGTTSLHEAFKRFGFDAGHWESAGWARAIWQEMNRWGSSRTLEQRYALTDNPIPVLYKKLDEAYPGSKFILTVREETEWLKSVAKFWTHEGNPRRWTWDVDGFSHKMHGIVYGTIKFDALTFLERYRRHNDEVTRYFNGRPDFMRLEIKSDTSMAGLCRFLNQPATNRKFPHQNKGESR